MKIETIKPVYRSHAKRRKASVIWHGHPRKINYSSSRLFDTGMFENDEPLKRPFPVIYLEIFMGQSPLMSWDKKHVISSDIHREDNVVCVRKRDRRRSMNGWDLVWGRPVVVYLDVLPDHATAVSVWNDLTDILTNQDEDAWKQFCKTQQLINDLKL